MLLLATPCSPLPASRPSRKAQAGAGAGGRAIARNIFEPAQVEMLDRARDRNPVEDFRAAGMKLVARQLLQERRILVGASLEDGAVEILVHQEMAQAAGGENSDALGAGKNLDRPSQVLSE